MTRPKKFKKVGAAFEQLFGKKGFKSAYELSKEDGLNKSYISKLVNGETGNPGPEKIKQIAEAFAKKSGLSVDDEIAELTKLFADDGNSFNQEEQQLSLSENTPKNEVQVVQEEKSQLSYFVGREAAIADLENLQKKGAKIIAIYGLGGIGKTTLAEKYFERQKFDIFRLQIGSESQDIPSVEQWVKYLLKNKFKEEPDADFSIMLEQLKTKLQILKCGLLIDNLEPALDKNGNFIEAHNSYIKLLKILADSTVKSLTLITSRERINDSRVNVDRYDLSGLDEKAWRDFLSYKEIDCNSLSLVQIQRACGGNAKAMTIIYGEIKNDYENNLDSFWQDCKQNLLKKNGIQDLIKRQFQRLKNIAPDSYRLIIRMGIFPYSKIPMISRNLVMCLLWDIPEAEKYQVIECLKNRYLVEFKNGEFWLHPIIRSEAMSRLPEIGKSSSEILFKFKQQNDLIIYSNNNLYNLFEWLSYKFVFAPSKYKKAAFRALMLGIVLDYNNYASQNYVDLSIDIDDCFENIKPEKLKIHAENEADEQLDFIQEKLEEKLDFKINQIKVKINKIKLKYPSIFFSHNGLKKSSESLSPDKNPQLKQKIRREVDDLEKMFESLSSEKFSQLEQKMRGEVIQEYIDELYDISLKQIHKMLDNHLRIELEIYIEIAINIFFDYRTVLVFKEELDQTRHYLIDKFYSARSKLFIDRIGSKQDFQSYLLFVLANENYNSRIESNRPIRKLGFNNSFLRVLNELLEEILIDDYEDKITESIDNFDWQFTDNEKELLTQYCQANRLIVECLNNVPSEVREEIEETLLLPLEEIEKWKQHHRPNNS